MASDNDIIEGLKILSKYEDLGIGSHDFCADHDIHDIIFDGRCKLDDNSNYVSHLSSEDHEKIIEFGWFLDYEEGSYAMNV